LTAVARRAKSSTATGNTASTIRTVQLNLQLDARDTFGITSAFPNSTFASNCRHRRRSGDPPSAV
jgi:hypothetical protein